ncbi:uncharacterized protein CDAR_41121 [Caerostris darwini]|uniref:Uncharacterized protein n=1 Tax=Caerostris darwini TaxID=1538125 RepID=A0AAV4W3V8_9ARAC|nr:uncharacterized protein CDAR_41121 [Caerostris darwini]
MCMDICKCRDVIECQKGTIVFGLAHGHTVSSVAGFIDVSQRAVEQVCKQWCNTSGHETQRQNCGSKTNLIRGWEGDWSRVSRLVNQT